MLRKFFIFSWLLGTIFLLLYSYTQIDLSLTLSRDSILQMIQKKFQYVGWFDRDLSANLFILLIILLTALYIITLILIQKKKINNKTLFIVIMLLSFILLFSYNSFSYDLFNYIFDAKIVTFYHKNPYLFKALDFPNDPMLSFMRSVHRVYPYGPVWIFVSSILSLIGFNIFTLTFALFKLLSVLSYLICCYLIYKISEIITGKKSVIAMTFFAFNPLVIIESVVSSHNEIFMMALALLSIYFLFAGKKINSAVTFIASVGIKFTTIMLSPIFILYFLSKKIDYKKFIEYCLILMIIAVIATSLASGQNKNPEFQPWYLVSLAPFVALTLNRWVKILFISISSISLFSYYPYISTGAWPENIVLLKNVLLMIGFVIGCLFLLIEFLIKKFKYAKK